MYQILIQLFFLTNCFNYYLFDDVSTKWIHFKEKFNKSYSTQQEHTFRRLIFEKNLDFINKFNQDHTKGLYSFKIEFNHFADLTIEEFVKQNNGILIDENSIKNDTIKAPNIRQKRDISIPNSLDWRLKNKVSPVINQGQDCGSCYAFATIASVESFKAINYNYMPNYSIQELIDCAYEYSFYNHKNCNGCDGGSLSCGFEYMKTKGLTDANLLKSSSLNNQTFSTYKGEDGVCKIIKKNKPIINEYSIYYDNATPEEIQTWLTYFGPIAIAINSHLPSFKFYKSGIYDDPNCNTTLTHAVLLVGFGSENGKDYWILKNSWSKNWGENGFMRIERGKNICGMELYGGFPVA